MATYLELNKNLTEEEEAIKQQVHRFAVDVLRPAAMELDKMSPEQVIDEDSPYWGVFRQAYALGYSRSYLPPALNGPGLSTAGTAHLHGGDGLGQRRLRGRHRCHLVPLRIRRYER